MNVVSPVAPSKPIIHQVSRKRPKPQITPQVSANALTFSFNLAPPFFWMANRDLRVTEGRIEDTVTKCGPWLYYAFQYPGRLRRGRRSTGHASENNFEKTVTSLFKAKAAKHERWKTQKNQGGFVSSSFRAFVINIAVVLVWAIVTVKKGSCPWIPHPLAVGFHLRLCWRSEAGSVLLEPLSHGRLCGKHISPSACILHLGIWFSLDHLYLFKSSFL
jgi:hypothetical protein